MREATRQQSPTVRVQVVIPVTLNQVQYTSTPSLDNRQQNSLEVFNSRGFIRIKRSGDDFSRKCWKLSGSTNASGSSARYNTANAITNHGTNMYVVDEGNHRNGTSLFLTDVNNQKSGRLIKLHSKDFVQLSMSLK